MCYCIEIAHLEQRIQRAAIRNITLYKGGLRRHRLTMPAIQAIKDSDFVTRFQELGGGGRADIACTACYENTHETLLREISVRNNVEYLRDDSSYQLAPW